MDKPKEVRCENCVFYSYRHGTRKCVRYPSPLDVDFFDWCGEFVGMDNLANVEWVAWRKGLLRDEVNER
jgi:hypothetical protein